MTTRRTAGVALGAGAGAMLRPLSAWGQQPATKVARGGWLSCPPNWGLFGEPELRIRAVDEAVPMLGAVLSYGHIVAPLQAAWMVACAREPQRLHSRFGTAVTALKNVTASNQRAECFESCPSVRRVPMCHLIRPTPARIACQ